MLQRVLIQFDGKNFYTSFRAVAKGARLDFAALARWLGERASVEGVPHIVTAAHYYTGVGESHDTLERFLAGIETTEPYFVHRDPRETSTWQCDVCDAQNSYTRERGVDARITAHMVEMACRDAFDVLVLVSGDSDLIPGVAAVQRAGKLVYVASWGGAGMSRALRASVRGHIDLNGCIDTPCVEMLPEDASRLEAAEYDAKAALRGANPEELALAEELLRMQRSMAPGYVGVNKFITEGARAAGRKLYGAEDVPKRRAILDRLIEQRVVEIYEVSGNKALKFVSAS